MTDNATNDDFDLSLLDKNVSEIEDLPSFEVPPKGTYILLCSMGTKKIEDAAYVTAEFEVVSTVEIANPNDPANVPCKDGTKFGTIFQLGNEFGEGNMKKFLVPFIEKFSTDNLRELVKDKVQNVLISAQLDHRIDKKDKTKVYPLVKNVVIQG